MKLENNRVSAIGYFANGLTYSHEMYGEKFYTGDLKTERLSGTKDIISVMVSERLLDVTEDYTGCVVQIEGQFRSYNKHEENRNRLMLSVFATDIEFLDGYVVSADNNTISLDGYICKSPIYRKTPLGREIADVLVAVNRSYGKSDYIPCICWSRTAAYVGNLPVGTKILITGRIQSREYQKKLENGEVEIRTCYEVSVSKLEVVSNEE